MAAIGQISDGEGGGSIRGKLNTAIHRVNILSRLLLADANGTNVNTAQPWFPTLGAVTLEANTTYLFRGLLRFNFTGAGATTSHTTGIQTGGTAVATLEYVADASTAANDTTLATVSRIAGLSSARVAVTAASTAATEDVSVSIRGVLRVTTGGTFIPQFSFSAAPGKAPVVKRGSFFQMRNIGLDTIQNIGTWS